MSNAQKQILHYMHFNKLWYYWLDEYECKKYWRKLEEDVKLLTDKIITERQCKETLHALFPKYKIIKAIPYHYSPSPWGSRPVKSTIDRKGMQREKIRFRKELEIFIK